MPASPAPSEPGPPRGRPDGPPPVPVPASPVPPAVDLAVAWTWRLAVLLGGVVLLGLVLRRLVFVTASFAAALLLTALLQPLVAALARRRVPRSAAAWLVFLGFLAALVTALRALGGALAAEVAGLAGRLSSGVSQARDAVLASPLPLDAADVDALAARLVEALRDGGAASGALSVADAAGDVLSGALFALFVLLVLLLDGEQVWRWLVHLVPQAGRERADGAGRAAWHTLVGYLRGIGTVALVDAGLVALALSLIGVPFVLPLAALTFLGAFVPYVGASVAGLVAALVALLDAGPVTALLVLAAVFGVQTLDGYVLEPLVVGKAVHLHPLAVVVAISVGGVLGGVGGAVVAVPLTACLNTAVLHLASTGPRAPG